MGNKTSGLLALLGLGALAYWKYKKSTPEQQQVVKDKINNAKDNINKWGNDLKDKANEVVSQAQNKMDEAKTKVEDTASNI
ncbi:YtxH domain-containing protein [Chryseobacterium echinoideorum]|uniref:YtxH domain-containing protein n=1 Tax=Chryseobacterium echinoideorum TaxID=1549648 RepID=UPI001185699E|nr:YtxH domain-containing protein [Chryseobacterium echinoideorum]